MGSRFRIVLVKSQNLEKILLWFTAIFFLSSCSLEGEIFHLSKVLKLDSKAELVNNENQTTHRLFGICSLTVKSFNITSPIVQGNIPCSQGQWETEVDLSSLGEGVHQFKTDLEDPKTKELITLQVVKDTTPAIVDSFILAEGRAYVNQITQSYVAGGSDIEKIYVSEDSTCTSGGVWGKHQDQLTISAGDGLKTFYAKTLDAAGNLSACVQVATITLDQTPPVITGLSDDLIVKGEKSWAWSCVDTSGSCEYRAQISESVPLAPAGLFTLANSATRQGDGTFYLNVQARDVAGNLSAVVSVKTILSENSPQLSIGNNSGYQNGNVVSIEGDGAQGYDLVEVSNDASCASATEHPVDFVFSWTLPAGEGLHTVYYRFKNSVTGVVTECLASHVRVDTTAPTVLLSSTAPSVFNTSTFAVQIDFSENVSGFTSSGITVSNGSVIGFSGSGKNYQATIQPTAEGSVVVSIAAGVAQDVALNGNLSSASLTRVYDITAPTLQLASVSGTKVSAPFVVTALFSETVTGFTLADIETVNATVSAFAGGGASYSFTVTPTAAGSLSVKVSAGASSDVAGNALAVAEELTRIYDNVVPVVTGLSDDAVWAKTHAWGWDCSESCLYRWSVTANAAGTPSGAYGATQAHNLSGVSGVYFLNVQAQDEAGNESVVTSVSARLDNTVPTAPSSVDDQVAKASIGESPVVSFTLGSDAHSGLKGHEARVLRVSDSAVMADWQAFVSGSTFSGLTLATNTQYKVQVRAVDNLDQLSSVAESNGWIADTAAPTAPTGLTLGSVPFSLSDTPTFSWTAASDGSGGTGVASYEVAVFRQSDSVAVSSWTTISSGASLSGLSLSNGIQYHFKVRARDGVSNLGTTSVASAAWTANNDPCSLPSPPAGSECGTGSEKTVLVGMIGGTRYMTTPSGCTGVPSGSGPGAYTLSEFTPVCNGVAADPAMYWNAGAYPGVDVTTLMNYTTTQGVGNWATNLDAVSGSVNTTNLVAAAQIHAAARYCDRIVYGGYDDWFLPSRQELNLLYANKDNLNGVYMVNQGQAHWSSTEYGRDHAWSEWMSDGYQAGDIKNVALQVRCMRKF